MIVGCAGLGWSAWHPGAQTLNRKRPPAGTEGSGLLYTWQVATSMQQGSSVCREHAPSDQVQVSPECPSESAESQSDQDVLGFWVQFPSVLSKRVEAMACSR